MAGLRVSGRGYPTREMTVGSGVNFHLDVAVPRLFFA